MRLLVISIILIISSSNIVLASNKSHLPNGAQYCLEDIDDVNAYHSLKDFQLNMQYKYGFKNAMDYYKTRFTCLEREAWMNGLEVVSITMYTTALAATLCSPATGGTSLTITLGTGLTIIGTRIARIALSSIPCEDSRKNKEIELKVKETICMIAGREDGHCDIDKVKVNYEERQYTPLREHRI